MKIKKKHRILKLLSIYAVSIIAGLLLVIVLDGPKVHATAFYLMVLLGLVLYIKTENVKWRHFLARPQKEGVVRIVAASIILFMQIAFIVALRTSLWEEGITEIFELDIFVCIGTCFLAPVAEELICRGIIVDILKEKHGNFFVVIVSALIFYVIHGNPVNIGTLIFGILAGWVVLKAKSILPGVIMHFLWNTVIYFLPIIASKMVSWL